jgi:hypothetical protein
VVLRKSSRECGPGRAVPRERSRRIGPVRVLPGGWSRKAGPAKGFRNRVPAMFPRGWSRVVGPPRVVLRVWFQNSVPRWWADEGVPSRGFPEMDHKTSVPPAVSNERGPRAWSHELGLASGALSAWSPDRGNPSAISSGVP